MTKRIGILTSGGDCAGLNATIRAVALRAHHGYGWTTIGIGHGTLGLLERPVEAVTLDPARLDAALARQGGTFLGTTNRGDPFAFPMPDGSLKDRSGEMVEGLRELRLDGLIGVGGDGSLDILRRLLAPSGLPFIGVPKTIDNDVGQTERAIGYSTAVAIATEALDRLQPTGASHERVMVLEVMGRDAGHIAIAAGIAGGADVVLIPEVRWRLDHVVRPHRRPARARAAPRRWSWWPRRPATPTRRPTRRRCARPWRRRMAGAAAGQGDRRGGARHGAGPRPARRHADGGGSPARLGAGRRARSTCWPTARPTAWWRGGTAQVIDVPLEKVVGRSRTVDPDGTLIRTARRWHLPRRCGLASERATPCANDAPLEWRAQQIRSRASQNTSPSLCSVSSQRKGRRGIGGFERPAAAADLAQQGAVLGADAAAPRRGCDAPDRGRRRRRPAPCAARGDTPAAASPCRGHRHRAGC